MQTSLDIHNVIMHFVSLGRQHRVFLVNVLIYGFHMITDNIKHYLIPKDGTWVYISR